MTIPTLADLAAREGFELLPAPNVVRGQTVYLNAEAIGQNGSLASANINKRRGRHRHRRSVGGVVSVGVRTPRSAVASASVRSSGRGSPE